MTFRLLKTQIIDLVSDEEPETIVRDASSSERDSDRAECITDATDSQGLGEEASLETKIIDDSAERIDSIAPPDVEIPASTGRGIKRKHEIPLEDRPETDPETAVSLDGATEEVAPPQKKAQISLDDDLYSSEDETSEGETSRDEEDLRAKYARLTRLMLDRDITGEIDEQSMEWGRELEKIRKSLAAGTITVVPSPSLPEDAPETTHSAIENAKTPDVATTVAPELLFRDSPVTPIAGNATASIVDENENRDVPSDEKGDKDEDIDGPSAHFKVPVLPYKQYSFANRQEEDHMLRNIYNGYQMPKWPKGTKYGLWSIVREGQKMAAFGPLTSPGPYVKSIRAIHAMIQGHQQTDVVLPLGEIKSKIRGRSYVLFPSVEDQVGNPIIHGSESQLYKKYKLLNVAKEHDHNNMTWTDAVLEAWIILLWARVFQFSFGGWNDLYLGVEDDWPRDFKTSVMLWPGKTESKKGMPQNRKFVPECVSRPYPSQEETAILNQCVWPDDFDNHESIQEMEDPYPDLVRLIANRMGLSKRVCKKINAMDPTDLMKVSDKTLKSVKESDFGKTAIECCIGKMKSETEEMFWLVRIRSVAYYYQIVTETIEWEHERNTRRCMMQEKRLAMEEERKQMGRDEDDSELSEDKENVDEDSADEE